MCRACAKPRDEPVTPDIVLTEDQWRCNACTLVNEIDWNSNSKTCCMVCGEPNQIIDDMIHEKKYFEMEQSLGIKPRCKVCFDLLNANGVCLKCTSQRTGKRCQDCSTLLINGECQRCHREREEICDKCCKRLLDGKCMTCVSRKCDVCKKYLLMHETKLCSGCKISQ